MKPFTILAVVAGLALVTVLVLMSGVREVGAAIASSGWATLLVVILRALTVLGAGLAWHLVFPADLRPRLSVCVLLRAVREGVNTLMPFTAVGGEFAGARLLTFYRVDGATASASVIVDLMVQAATQFLFTLAGLVALIVLGGDETIVRIVGIGMALTAPALVAFYVIQRRAGHRLMQGLLTRFAGSRQWQALGAVDALFAQLRRFYGEPAGLAAGAAVHFGVWFLGALEVFVALAFMGHPVGFAEALVIESLGQAVRSAAFAVPGAIGVQEGGLIALGAMFGVPAETALALSLIKRVADLAVGVPGLLAWQTLEGRRFLRRRDRASLEPVAEKNGDPLA